MKRLFAAALAALSTFAFGATLNPVQLLNPAGSTAGQAILSTGPSSAPAWGTVTLGGVSGTLAIANGGTGATSASAARTNLGLGTAATVNTGTSGATIPLLNGTNTWAAAQTFSVGPIAPTAAFGTSTTQVATTAFATAAAAGRLVNVQVFTSSGTYTPTSGATRAIVKVQAPGGGSGGVPATSAGQGALSGGGGSGSYAEAFISSGLSTQTITIGAVGAAGASGANAGGAGGTTSFGSLISCPGGVGGAAGSAVSTVTNSGTSTPASACTISGPATIASVPGGGSLMGAIYVAGASGFTAAGGNSVMGIGGRSVGVNVAAQSGTGYGAGAGGTGLSASGSAAAGAAGQPAIIEVLEFQ
ncbi:hypothetical protein A9R05_06935 [Burkholderia sp. KK1]|nr:hypothetical protein A9R05_06935 [Burkholderia sp. KK1]